MGQLRDRMEGDLLLKGVAEVTRAEYLRCATQLAAHYRRSPAALGADEVRAYLVHLVDTLHYSPANLKMHVAALKFLYTVTLNRPEVVARIPLPKSPAGPPRHPESRRGRKGPQCLALAEVSDAAVLCLRLRAARLRSRQPVHRRPRLPTQHVSTRLIAATRSPLDAIAAQITAPPEP